MVSYPQTILEGIFNWYRAIVWISHSYKIKIKLNLKN